MLAPTPRSNAHFGITKATIRFGEHLYVYFPAVPRRFNPRFPCFLPQNHHRKTDVGVSARTFVERLGAPGPAGAFGPAVREVGNAAGDLRPRAKGLHQRPERARRPGRQAVCETRNHFLVRSVLSAKGSTNNSPNKQSPPNFLGQKGGLLKTSVTKKLWFRFLRRIPRTVSPSVLAAWHLEGLESGSFLPKGFGGIGMRVVL